MPTEIKDHHRRLYDEDVVALVERHEVACTANIDGQLRRVELAKSRGRLDCAECGRVRDLINLYRCYYCGQWFCDDCSPEHFGQSREEYFSDDS